MNERVEKILLLAVLPLLIAVLTWFVFLAPKYQEYQDTTQARDEAKANESLYTDAYKVSKEEQDALAGAFPAAPDADGTRRWLTQLAQMSGGSVTDFNPAAQGNTFTVRMGVPKQDAADLVAQILRGLSRDELLPLARASQPDAHLVRIRSMRLVTSQNAGAAIEMTLLIPART